MAVYRAQIAFQANSALPRDAMLITPHYTGSDPAALANGLKTNLIANANVSTLIPFTINVYDAQGAPPHHPLATATQTGTPKTPIIPSEISLCLSYFATVNQPRKRGRLYLPVCLWESSPPVRPNAAALTRALSFGPTLFKSLPSGTVPVVFSRVTNTTNPITDYWVDDEWDTVRSRGLRATTRQTGTVP